jgi:hypothetical protein
MALPPDEGWPSQDAHVMNWAEAKLESLLNYFSDDWLLINDVKAHLHQLRRAKQKMIRQE